MCVYVCVLKIMCPEAAHLWGRRRHRRAPAGTAGTDGSSRRCPPHTACGLWETGPGDTVPELTLDPHSRLARLGHPPCPSSSSSQFPTTRNPVYIRAPPRPPPLWRPPPALAGRIPGPACLGVVSPWAGGSWSGGLSFLSRAWISWALHRRSMATQGRASRC